MPLQRLIIVQPCYSLEDLPRNLTADSADDYHQCWTSLWHPTFLQLVGSLPEWKRSDSSSLDVANALIVIPAAASEHIDTTLRERIDLNENKVVFGQGSRAATVAAIAAALECKLPLATDVRSNDSVTTPFGAEAQRTPVSVQTFFALGFVYQQLHILTRKVHYSNNLDPILFQEQLAQAAVAWNEGNIAEAEKWIQSCFDQLSQERDRYFSQQANLVDLTLVAQTTLSDSFTRQMQHKHPLNVLASASLLKTLELKNSEAFHLLKERTKSQTCNLIGGFDYEPPNQWLNSHFTLRSIAKGKTAYQQLGLKSPRVFSRLSGGLQPNDSQLLRISGLQNAVISAWLDGELPRSEQAKIRWQSSDGKSIDAIAAFVAEANSTLSILSIAVEFAKQFDYHQVPTLVLAHWPNSYCEAFTDLLLAVERTAALGKWNMLNNYFETTGQPYSDTVLPISQFKFDLPAGFESYASFCRELAYADRTLTQIDGLRSLFQLASHLSAWMSRTLIVDALSEKRTEVRRAFNNLDQILIKRLGPFLSPLALKALGEAVATESAADIKLDHLNEDLGKTLIELLSGKSSVTVSNGFKYQSDRTASIGNIVKLPKAKYVYALNPYSVPIRQNLRTGDTRLVCEDASRIYADESSASTRKILQSGLLGKIEPNAIGGNEIVIDIPATGVVQLECKSGATLGSFVSRRSNLASSATTFGNEYLDIQLDQKSGFIRAMLVNRKRGSRMSGQLSILDPGKLLGLDTPTDGSRYASAQDVTITLEHNSTTSAVIASRGRLVYEGHKLADFEILYELWRGSRLLQITPRLDWKVSRPDDSIWIGAPVWRSAWPSEAASLMAWRQGLPTKVTTATFFSHQVIEVDDAEHKLFLMMQGANLHRRRESRYMDTHLGSGQQVSILAGLDVPNPIQQWSSWLSGPMLFSSDQPMAGGQQLASFASTGSRGLQIDCIDPAEYFSITADVERSEGFPFDAYFLLQETLGKAGSSYLQFFRDVKSAAKVDSNGQSDEAFETMGGVVQLKLRSCETMWIGVNWA